MTEAGQQTPEPDGTSEDAGLRLCGIVRARRGRHRVANDGGADVIRYRDVAALVRPGAAAAADASLDEQVREHQRFVERVMRRGTILPLPYGIVFQNRRALTRFLKDQYLALDEGLSLVKGHWEMRVHVTTAPAPESAGDPGDSAMHLYSELRRGARAAIPFPREDERRFTAAFLVDRSEWIDFVERADGIGAARPELTVDVTGPWPPYDFVRLVD